MTRWVLVAWLCCPAIAGAQEIRCAAVKATGEILYCGQAPYDVEPGLSPGQIRIVLSTPPDVRMHKWTGTRTALRTPSELEAYDAAKAVATLNASTGFLGLLTAEPTMPKDGAVWIVCTGTSPLRTCALKFRDLGVTRTFAPITF